MKKQKPSRQPPKSFKKAKPLLFALAILALSGCSTPTPSIDPVAVLKSVPRVHNSSQAPCGIQKEIAAQNAWIDTATNLSKGQGYAAPCELKPKDQKLAANPIGP